MMNFRVRIIALMLAIVMCLCVFVSCAKSDADKAADSTADATNNPDAFLVGSTSSSVDSFDTPERYTIAKSGTEINFKLTRSAKLQTSTTPIIKHMNEISKVLQGLFAVSPSQTTDGTTPDSAAFEIIVGPTVHPETQAIINDCAYGEYLVRGVGNKIILLGYTDKAIAAAADHLMMLIAQGYDEATGTVTINTEELNSEATAVNQRLAAVPVYTGGSFLTYYDAGLADANRQCDEIIIDSTNATEFDAYIEKLKTSGYTVYNTNTASATGSEFVTLNSADFTINAGYYAYESRVRIAVEPLAPEYQIDTGWERIQASAVYMLGVMPSTFSSGSNRDNGLSMVIKLEDGRFIVIDGGEDSYSLSDSTGASYSDTVEKERGTRNYSNVNHLLDILNVFYDSSKYSQPTVAAWILTHDHGDHADLLQHDYEYLGTDHPNLTYSNGNKTGTKGIVVQNIYMSAYSKYETSKSSLSSERYQDIMNKVAPYFGATVHRVHPGWKLQIANCEVEFMYTLEAWADNENIVNNLGLTDSTSLGGYNHSSLVFKTTLEDSNSGATLSVLNTGDASSTGISIANKLFGDAAIKTDVLVLSHHSFGSGYDVLMQEMYTKIAATIALVPRSTVYTSRDSTMTAVNAATTVYQAGTAGNNSETSGTATNYGNTVTVNMNKTVTTGSRYK